MMTTTQNNSRLLSRFLCVAICLPAFAALAGCTSLHSDPNVVMDQVPPGEPQPEVVVKLIDANGEVQRLKAPLTSDMFIQDALKGSGATRRFSRMDVVLVRVSDDGQNVQRLSSTYDPKKRSIVDSQNYYLRGGDCLEVREDDSMVWERMLESIFKPVEQFVR